MHVRQVGAMMVVGALVTWLEAINVHEFSAGIIMGHVNM
jgi:hypothetical protein